jgi:predicted phosphodiesterase
VSRCENDPRLEVDPGRKLHGLSVELLSTTIAEVNSEPDVDAVLVLGDLTRDSEEFNHAAARDLLAGIRAPYYIVLGNHDMLRQRPPGEHYEGVRYLDRVDVARYHRDRGFPNGRTQYVAELPRGFALVVLDSNRTLAEVARSGEPQSSQEDGWLGPVQLGWLDGMLGRVRGSGRLPIVAVHHSVLEQSPAERPDHLLYGAFRHWRLTDAPLVVECLRRHKVRLVLSGHLHAQSVSVSNGLCNLVTSASVSYPHAWRLLTISRDAIEIQSRPLAAIPSVPNLQERSRRWMAEGMSRLIANRVENLPLGGEIAEGLLEAVEQSGWWPRFCDGTLAGFRIDPALLPRGGIAAAAIVPRVVQVLNEYGDWKAARPDPNDLVIPLAPR